MGHKQGLHTTGNNMPRNAQTAPLRAAGISFSGDQSMHRNHSTGDQFGNNRSAGYYDSFYHLFGSSSLFNVFTATKGMEVKAVIAALMATGLASYIMAIVLNITNWRSNVLFVLGAGFMMVRIIVFAAKSWLTLREKWRDLKVKEWEFQQKIKASKAEE